MTKKFDHFAFLDRSREVQYVWVAQEWPDFPNYDEAEAAIERL